MTRKKTPRFQLPNDGTRVQKLHELNILALNNFNNADVIFGLDEESGNQFLVFGGEVFWAIVETNEDRKCSVIVVPILQRTAELEALVAAVEVARSYSDYASAGQCVADVLELRRRDFDRLVRN